MERSNSDLFLTSSDAAKLLSVHPSTVKRWCNEGELASTTTEGGHRRIHLGDLLVLTRRRGITTFLDPFHPYEGHVWSAFRQVIDKGSFHRVHSLAMGWLGRAHIDRLTRLFVELGRQSEVSFGYLVDEGIRGFMTLVGQAWRDGKLRVGEEHMMTEAMIDVLAQLRPGGGPSGDASDARGEAPRRCAVVGTMEGHRHRLGSLCARILLERRGWDVYYLGADVPVEDFAAIQAARGASLVCVSFSPPATGADMRRCIRMLGGFYSTEHPYSLALGGDAGELGGLEAETHPFAALATFGGVADFADALTGGFANRTGAVRVV